MTPTRVCPSSTPHPCNFRLHRTLDRGWGEIAFEYRWDSTSGEADAGSAAKPDLAHCHLYEWARYSGAGGHTADGWFHPADPPFPGWMFRDPMDGRTAPVGLECFPASQGWAWDRHKIGGRLVIPPPGPREYLITATQTYRFFCDRCGVDEVLPGSHSGPHSIRRAFRRKEDAGEVWRYSITKHDQCAWMELGPGGFIADSLGLEYGPWFGPDA